MLKYVKISYFTIAIFSLIYNDLCADENVVTYELLSPRNEGIVYALAPLLEFNTSKTGNFRVEIDSQLTFENPEIIDIYKRSSASTTVRNLVYGTTYYWRVSELSQQTQGWSDTLSFTYLPMYSLDFGDTLSTSEDLFNFVSPLLQMFSGLDINFDTASHFTSPISLLTFMHLRMDNVHSNFLPTKYYYRHRINEFNEWSDIDSTVIRVDLDYTTELVCANGAAKARLNLNRTLDNLKIEGFTRTDSQLLFSINQIGKSSFIDHDITIDSILLKLSYTDYMGNTILKWINYSYHSLLSSSIYPWLSDYNRLDINNAHCIQQVNVELDTSAFFNSSALKTYNEVNNFGKIVLSLEYNYHPILYKLRFRYKIANHWLNWIYYGNIARPLINNKSEYSPISSKTEVTINSPATLIDSSAVIVYYLDTTNSFNSPLFHKIVSTESNQALRYHFYNYDTYVKCRIETDYGNSDFSEITRLRPVKKLTMDNDFEMSYPFYYNSKSRPADLAGKIEGQFCLDEQFTEACIVKPLPYNDFDLVYNLELFTQYYYRERWINPIDTSEWSPIGLCYTNNDYNLPVTPKKIYPGHKSVDINNKRLSFMWENRFEDQENVSFRFKLFKDSISSNTLVFSTIISSKQEQLNIEDLDDNSTYYWNIYNKDKLFDDFLQDYYAFSTGITLGNTDHEVIFSIHPNPTAGRITVNSTGYNSNILKLLIFNNVGKLVEEHLNIRESEFKLNQTAGIYTAVLELEDGKLIYKKIIIH